MSHPENERSIAADKFNGRLDRASENKEEYFRVMSFMGQAIHAGGFSWVTELDDETNEWIYFPRKNALPRGQFRDIPSSLRKFVLEQFEKGESKILTGPERNFVPDEWGEYPVLWWLKTDKEYD